MPIKHKELYIAKSMHELNLKTNVDTDKNTKIKIYCRSANRMFQEAEKADRNMDEERAYVLYMKFTSLVQYICKAKEYKADKEYYDSLGGIKNVLTAIGKAEELQKSLITRYEYLKEEEEIKARLEAGDQAPEDIAGKPSDGNINVNAFNQDAALKKEISCSSELGQDGGMTACQLYRLFEDSTKKILVIDVRSSEQYKFSRIQNAQVINVPEEVIKPGTTVTVIAKGLSSDVKETWNMRGSVDCIVILDWNSTARDLTKGSTLASLKDALTKWDSTVTLKLEPLVLDGGYEAWLLRYPMLTTNPHVTRPPVDSSSSASLSLLDFDYPSLEDDQPNHSVKPKGPVVKPSISSGSNEQTTLPSNAMNSETISVITPTTVHSPKSIPTVNRSVKPKQLQENLSSPNKSPSSVARTHGPSASSLAGGNTKGATAQVSSSSLSVSDKNKESSSSNNVLSVVPSTESSQVTITKPMIPNRSLKPLVQDSNSVTAKENGKTKAAVCDSLKDDDEEEIQNQMKGVGRVNKAKKEDTQTYAKEGKGAEGVRELTRMQKEHQIQEQQALLELEKMRQEKMKMENNQLRLEKAQMEKQLEEKVSALKRMQEQLEEQDKATQAEDEQQQLTTEGKKTESDKELNSQTHLIGASIHRDVKIQDEGVAKLVKETSSSPAKGGSKPQLQGEVGTSKIPHADAGKPAQPTDQRSIPSMSITSVTPAPTVSSSMQNAKLASGTALTLPVGWEKKLHPASNKYYYIDHNTETTHWSPPAMGSGGAASTTTAAVSSTRPSSTVSSAKRPETKDSGSPAKQTTLSSTTKTHLKSDNSGTPQSSLKRSFSSPNIAQMVINEENGIHIPTVNRANKPVQRMPSSSVVQSPPPQKPLAVTRARNLNPVYGSQGRSLTGLRNLGNTCFMNSVVQCLSNSTPLTHYFITDKYVPDINRQNPLGRGGNVAQEFAVVIKAIWSGQYRSISPLDLRDTVTKYVPEFRKNIGHHHDSQEFLLFLLDGLHEDLNQVKKREYLKEEDLEKFPDHVAADISWKYHQKLNQSIIVTLFQGQFKSMVRCLSCGHSSVKFEAFMYLSLPIPSSSRCTLQQCLQKFSTEEKLTGDNAIYCSKCKSNRDSAKIILIWKLPRILLIHLKRFYYEGMWRQKLQTVVDFPLHNMDMSPYTRGPKPNKSYYLYAVSNHIGTLDGGHYTACCLNVNNSWYKFDDHEVYEASQNNIKSAAAYILFYSSMDQFIP